MALTFLTVLPLPVDRVEEGDIRDSLRVFPLAGLVVGILCAVPVYLLDTPASQALAAILVNYLLTRGLHFDGFVDTLEALGGGHTPEKRREILKDTHIGALGLLAGALLLLSRYHLLSYLGKEEILRGIVVAPIFGRGAIVAVSFLSGSASPRGLGAIFAAEKRPLTVCLAGLATLPALLWLSPGTYLFLLAITALMGQVMAWSASRAFGGITGDVLGCSLELTELVVLATLSWGGG